VRELAPGARRELRFEVFGFTKTLATQLACRRKVTAADFGGYRLRMPHRKSEPAQKMPAL
jgi:hypothetical protein